MLSFLERNAKEGDSPVIALLILRPVRICRVVFLGSGARIGW